MDKLNLKIMIAHNLKSYESPALATLDMWDFVENMILCTSGGGTHIVDMSVCDSKDNSDFDF